MNTYLAQDEGYTSTLCALIATTTIPSWTCKWAICNSNNGLLGFGILFIQSLYNVGFTFCTMANKSTSTNPSMCKPPIVNLKRGMAGTCPVGLFASKRTIHPPQKRIHSPVAIGRPYAGFGSDAQGNTSRTDFTHTGFPRIILMRRFMRDLRSGAEVRNGIVALMALSKY